MPSNLRRIYCEKKNEIKTIALRVHNFEKTQTCNAFFHNYNAFEQTLLDIISICHQCKKISTIIDTILTKPGLHAIFLCMKKVTSGVLHNSKYDCTSDLLAIFFTQFL